MSQNPTTPAPEGRLKVTLEPCTIYRALEDDSIEGWGLFRAGSLMIGSSSYEEAIERADQYGFEITNRTPGRPDVQPRHFVSGTCRGERCSVCGRDATHKLGEEIAFDDPLPFRHNLTAYVCCQHFVMIVRSDCGKWEVSR